MRRFRMFMAAVAMVSISLGIAIGLTACSTSPAEPTVTVGANTLVVDVRTPSEFASGHLEGAVNINWEGDFAAGIASLPLDGNYLLYCRSGNRAGQAKSAMGQLGFTDVANLGSVQDASAATGLPIVK